MEKINLYNIKKKYLMDLIQKSSDMMRELSMPNETEKCATLLKRLREETFKVVIMGRFKVGKSTFINALLGNGDMLPAKATPCTAIINEVKYSKDERYAIIHFKHPIPTPMPKLAPNVKAYIEKFAGKPVSPIKIKPNDINQFVVINDEAEDQKEGTVQAPFEKAEIFWDLPLCEQGVEIIDTPGLEENIARTIVTKSYLTQADAIVFVLDCNALCSESEKESIQEDVQSAGHDYAIFVCNRINQIKDKDKDELKSRAYKMLQDKTQLGREGVVFIDAETAKDSKAANDMDKYAQTGMPEFEEQLSKVLVNKRGNIKLAQPAKQLESAIEYALVTAIPNERQMLSTSTAEIQKRLQQELPNLENLRRRKELLIVQLETEIKEICRETEQLLQQHFNGISSCMPKIVNGIVCDSHVTWNPFKAKQSVKDFTNELIEKLQRKLTKDTDEWQKAELEVFISSKLQKLADKFQTKLTDIFIEIEKVKLRIAGLSDADNPTTAERVSASVIGLLTGVGFVATGVGGALGFSKEFVTVLAAQIAAGVILSWYIGITNPFTIVMMLAIAFKGAEWAMGKAEEKIRNKIGEQVQTQLLEEKEESIRKAVDVIKQQLENGKANVLEAIDNELLSVEKMVEQIKREKDAGEQNVKVKLAQLDSKAATFRGLLANLQSFITNMQKQDIDFEPLPMPDEVPSNENPSQDNPTPSPQGNEENIPTSDKPVLPEESDDKVECTNPACVNYKKKVLPAGTKFCSECGCAIVKEVKPEPDKKDERIACPNPACKNHTQKVLSPNTKFCPECGTKIVVQQNNPQPQQSSNSTYVIDPKLDKFEKDGVVYIKALNHKHGDNECGGEVYIGDNAIVMCGKCGVTKRITDWYLLNGSDVLTNNKISIVTTKQRTTLDTNLAYNWGTLPSMGRKWLRKFASNFDDYFNEF